MAEAELRLAEEQGNPVWQISTGVRRYEGTDDFAVVAGISTPFGRGNRNQGRIAEIKARLSQQGAEAEALRIRIETSLFIVYEQLLNNIHQRETLKNDIVPTLEHALRETNKAYELGKYSYPEWLVVRNELLDAQSALTDVSLAAQLSQNEIERLTGASLAKKQFE